MYVYIYIYIYILYIYIIYMYMVIIKHSFSIMVAHTGQKEQTIFYRRFQHSPSAESERTF